MKDGVTGWKDGSDVAASASPGAWRRLALTAQMLRHVRPGQVAWRLRSHLLGLLPDRWIRPPEPRAVPRLRPDPDGRTTLGLRHTLPPETARRRAAPILEGEFTFLNRTRRYDDGVEWDAPGESRLWRFHLHYFDYALPLARTYRLEGGDEHWDRFRSLVLDWIGHNPSVRGDGWHPYTISVRTANWIRAYRLFSDRLEDDEAFRGRMLRSLFVQTRHLWNNPERDVPGNHLVRNGRALVFAGRFFAGEEAGRWLEGGSEILAETARAQVLPDGGHFERSPLYHAQVLGDFLDGVALLDPGGRRAILVEAVGRMLPFLRDLRHPDGSLPLFQDSVSEPDPAPEALFSYAGELLGEEGTVERSRAAVRAPASGAGSERGGAGAVGSGKNDGGEEPRLVRYPDSGFYAFRTDGHFLVLDCGPPGPEHLPGHAHCGLLSFELSVEGRRIVTNGGTFQYEAGPWRQVFRGTAAHNTVQVGDEEQSAIWGGFRMGRRARVTEAVTSRLASGHYFRGGFRGFEGNRILHTRELFLLEGPCWVVVDRVTARDGRGFSATSRLCFHPGCRVSPVDASRLQVELGEVRLEALALGAGGWELDRGWHAPDFGVREPCPVAVLQRGEGDGGNEYAFGYILTSAEVHEGSLRVLADGATSGEGPDEPSPGGGPVGSGSGAGRWRLRLRIEDREYCLSTARIREVGG